MKTNDIYDPAQMDGFIERLMLEGAELKDLTNEWEVARWKWNDKTLIIYKNKHNHLSFSDSMASIQYSAYEHQKPWPHKLVRKESHNREHGV